LGTTYSSSSRSCDRQIS